MISRSGLRHALRASPWQTVRAYPGRTLGAALLVFLYVVFVPLLPFVMQLDLAIADERLRAFMPRTIDRQVVIVDIDEPSLADMGRWPWGRDRMAELTDELFDNQGAAVVGFDLLFIEPDPSSALLERMAKDASPAAKALAPFRESLDFDARFERALADRNVVLGYYFTADRAGHGVGTLPAPAFAASALQGRPVSSSRWDGYNAPLPKFMDAAASAGFINSVPDKDGIVRSVPLIGNYGVEYFEPLSLAMYRVYTGATVQPETATGRFFRQALQSVVLTRDGVRQTIPVDAFARVRVPFRGPGGPGGGSFEYISATQLLKHKIDRNHLKGKIVLVGTTVPGSFDMRATPVGEAYPGVEVHANLISGFLGGRLPVEPYWANQFDMLQLVVVAALLGWALPRLPALRSPFFAWFFPQRPALRDALLAAMFTALFALALVASNLWAYRALGLLLPLAAALLLTGLFYVANTVWSYVVEGSRGRSLTKVFESYVSPKIVRKMARDPDRYGMNAENRELTVMFCDLRDFTQLSEELKEPEKLRALVNAFFTTMTTAILARDGTLDKYIGDSIMAFWGAPDPDLAHASNAVHVALEMSQRLETLNKVLSAEGKPELGMGIGLNTGEVFVGDMGSKVRRSYTVMGDPVNVASRIEGLTRHYGVEILLGDATRAAADRRPLPAVVADWHWVEVDRVRGKGMKRPVTLFTPVRSGTGPGSVSEEEMRLWPLALEAYRHHHWSEAKARLEGLQTTFAGSPLKTLYTLITERCDRYNAKPPSADWDGVHTFDSK
jgi:adenylate cyclase